VKVCGSSTGPRKCLFIYQNWKLVITIKFIRFFTQHCWIFGAVYFRHNIISIWGGFQPQIGGMSEFNPLWGLLFFYNVSKLQECFQVLNCSSVNLLVTKKKLCVKRTWLVLLGIFSQLSQPFIYQFVSTIHRWVGSTYSVSHRGRNFRPTWEELLSCNSLACFWSLNHAVVYSAFL
jgi:hypothetical protein